MQQPRNPNPDSNPSTEAPNDDSRVLTTRRKFLLAGALAGGGVMGLAEALDGDGAIGDLWAGMAALPQAYNVAGNLWVGPSSARSSVAAKSGRIYMESDTFNDYYGDGGTWQPYGYGTAANPGPPVYTTEVTTEGLKNSIGDAAIQASWDGLVVPVANGVGMDSAIAPGSTTTPVQDAIDVVNANGVTLKTDAGPSGAVLLPPTQISEAGSLTGLGGTALLGWGDPVSQIQFTDLTASGIAVNAVGDGELAYLDGLALHGSDKNNRTGGSAIDFNATVESFQIGRVRLTQWATDPVIHFDTGHTFAFRWDHVYVDNCDAVSFTADDGGTGSHIGLFESRSNGGNLGLDVNFPPRLELTVDTYMPNGDHGAPGHIEANSGYVNIRNTHYEDTGANNPGQLYFISGSATVDLGWVKNVNSTVNYIYSVSGGTNENTYLGLVENDGTINNSVVRLNSDPDSATVIYQGPIADVRNTTGATLTNPVVCLGDLAKKASTGTGYDGGTDDVRL